MADYLAGYEITKYLKCNSEDIVGLAVHDISKENIVNMGYTDDIIKIANLPKTKIFNGVQIQSGDCLNKIMALNPEIILSIFWGYLLKPELISIPNYGCINLHLSYLPYNRGRNPNIWSIVDETPAGVTLHYINNGVDSGDIIVQSKVEVEPVDTGETLYNKLVKESIELFKNNWINIKNGALTRTKQDDSNATYHRMDDIHKLDKIDLDKEYKARDLINLLRARTFLPHNSVYFIENGKKIYVRVDLQYAMECNV
jgi:methionyl-tRNA formyltransferase